MSQKLIPGTALPYSDAGGTFNMFKPLIKATDGLTLSQVCAVTGLEASTVQNWVKRKFVARPINKKYHERQLARILLISSLRECMKIENIGELMSMVNGDANDESDDIISEDKLYDYFCEIIGHTNDVAPSDSEIESLIENVIKDYKPPHKNDKLRLKDALTVMVYAYTAAEYKKRADLKLNQMKENLK